MFKEILVQDHFYRKYWLNHKFFELDLFTVFHSWWWTMVPLLYGSPIVSRGWAWDFVRGDSSLQTHHLLNAIDSSPFFGMEWFDAFRWSRRRCSIRAGSVPRNFVIIRLPLSTFWRSKINILSYFMKWHEMEWFWYCHSRCEFEMKWIRNIDVDVDVDSDWNDNQSQSQSVSVSVRQWRWRALNAQ